MSPELEARIYNNVLRSVLWDTDQEEAVQMLQASGITGEAAEQMFSRARRERITLIRNEGFQRAMKGISLMAGGILLFAVFWFGLGFIMRPIIIISGLLVAAGFWWMTTGLMDALLAPTRKGSVID